MVNRTDIVKAFIHGGEKGKASSLSISRRGNATLLYSFATPIAYRDNKGKIYATDKKFSQTTTVQQNALKREGKVTVEKNNLYKKRLSKNNVFDTGRL